MTSEGRKLTERSLIRLEAQLLRAEGGAFDPPPRRGDRRRRRDPTPRVVMLLEDCQSGGRAQAAILIEVESSETQIVEICGDPLSGNFQLEFDGETTAAIDYDATAAEFQEALEEIANINPGDVRVELGPGSEVGSQVIYRWLVHFTGQYERLDVPELIPRQVAIPGQGAFSIVNLAVEVRSQPDLEDTGETLTALCVVPLPPGVVLFAGSIGITLFVPGFGHCFVAVECHDCEAY